MTDVDPHATRRDPGVLAELLEAGFDNVEEIGRGGPASSAAASSRAGPRRRQVGTWMGQSRSASLRESSSTWPPFQAPAHRDRLAGGRVGGWAASFIVMPYRTKNSLETLIRRLWAMDWRETLSISVKLAGALKPRIASAPCTVKPGNILLTDTGAATDRFRNRQNRRGFETATGVISGSPAFTAPEVLEGHRRRPASDVYSWARRCSVR